MALPKWQVEKDVYTEDDYFAFEQESFARWEFVGGEIRAMAGGTEDHGTIAVNVTATLRNALAPRGCRVYGSDVKIHTGDGVNTYPDASVVCGPREYWRRRKDTICNPVLLVEVLSESTEGYDRGEKWDHYQTIPSLVDYLLVAPDEARVLLYSREGDHWSFREVAGLGSVVELPSLGTGLALSEVYALIEFGG